MIIISERDVDLRSGSTNNTFFLLKIAEGSFAAGGRGGGFGERRVVGVFCFSSRGGVWRKLFETQEESVAASFEVPYYVSRIPFVLPNGAEEMGYGVVEAELVRQMAAKAGVTFSP